MNKKKSILLIIAVIAICFFIYLFKGNFNKGDYSQTYYDLNTVSEITLYNVKESDSKEILKKCGDILLNIDNTMSKTREASDVYKINQNAGEKYVKISDDTFEVIQKAIHFSNISDGVFDISIGPVVDLWAIGTDKARVPGKDEIKEKLEKAQGVVLADYQGLSVEEDTMLRKSLREAGVEYKVYKNSLVTRAANELGLGDVVQYLEGPVSIAFGYEDATAPARVLNNFAKDHKKLELKAGIVDGIVYDKTGVEKLATIPSKEVLIAKLLGSFKAPLSNFAYLINAIKDKKESESAE